MTVAGTALLAALGTLLALVALTGAVAFARGWEPHVKGPARPARRGRKVIEELPAAWRERYRPLVVVAVVGGLLVFAFTGWLAHGLLTAVAVAGVPFVLHPDASGARRISALEALKDWLNQLAAVHVAGLSLEQTIRSTAKNAPAAVRPHVQRLASRLEGGWAAEDAYKALADDMAEGAVDHVVLLLQSHARDRGPGLSRALEDLAESLGRQVEDARAVEADRVKVRTSARWISLFTLGTVVVLLINRAYTAPYGTAQGQLLLVLLGGMFAFLLVQMRKMARSAPDPRLLAPSPPAEAGPAGSGPPSAVVEEEVTR